MHLEVFEAKVLLDLNLSDHLASGGIPGGQVLVLIKRDERILNLFEG
jgi:hypothetical protein